MSSTSEFRPWVQVHFVDIQDNGVPKRRCLAENCNKTYAIHTSHIVLKKHWASAHDEEQKKEPTVFLFSDEHTKDQLVKFIIDGHYEYSMVERKRFRSFCMSLNPKVGTVSRHHISDLINNGRNNLKGKIMKKLEEATSVALTFDIWTAFHCYRAFAAVTAHFIDENIEMKEFTLEFQYLPYPHGTIPLSEFMENVIWDFGIRSKVISITTDNAENNKTALNHLNSKLDLSSNFSFRIVHFRCLAHVINLAVKLSLKSLKTLVTDIKKIVDAIHGSTKRCETFRSIQQKMIDQLEDSREDQDPMSVSGDSQSTSFSIREPLNLIADVDTRWNSTFLLIDRAFVLRHAIDRALREMVDLKGCSEIDWNKARVLIGFLRPFYEVTNLISGTKYPTISLITSIIPKLKYHASLEYDGIVGIENAAKDFTSKIKEYEKVLQNDLTLIATVLDPRMKLAKIPEHLKEKAISIIRDIIKPDAASEGASTSNRSYNNCSMMEDIFPECDENLDELDTYLSIRLEPAKTELLSFWKSHKDSYPRLYQLARQKYAVQTTSVASERVFSEAKLVDDPRRGRLDHESFRSNILPSSWMKFLELS